MAATRRQGAADAQRGRVRALMALRAERAAYRAQPGPCALPSTTPESPGSSCSKPSGSGSRSAARVVDPRLLAAHPARRSRRPDRSERIGEDDAVCGCSSEKLEPDERRVRRGARLQVAYFDQQREQLDPDATLADSVNEGNTTVIVNGQPRHVDRLPRGLPVSARARAVAGPVAVRRRAQPADAGAALCQARERPRARRADQRSRHRDARAPRGSCSAGFDGTVLLVSHDRAFLDNVVTSTLAFEAARRVSSTSAAGRTICGSLRLGTRELGARERGGSRARYPQRTRSRSFGSRGPGSEAKTDLQRAARARHAAGSDRGARARAARSQSGDGVARFLQGGRRTHSYRSWRASTKRLASTSNSSSDGWSWKNARNAASLERLREQLLDRAFAVFLDRPRSRAGEVRMCDRRRSVTERHSSPVHSNQPSFS